MIVYSTQEVFVHDLSAEGDQLAEQGSHEARVWNALPMKGESRGLTIPQLKAAVGDESAKIGQGRAFKNGWIGKEGDTLVKLVSGSPSDYSSRRGTQDLRGVLGGTHKRSCPRGAA
jgi:phenylalanyl-tRNA synthetase alpha chain